MPIAELPDDLVEVAMKAGFRGIFYGGCIERKEGSSFRRKAHCHCYKKNDKYFGWICYRSAKRLNDRRLLIHELSHLITQQGHTKKFYICNLQLGGRITKNDKRMSPLSTERAKKEYSKRKISHFCPKIDTCEKKSVFMQGLKNCGFWYNQCTNTQKKEASNV